MFSKWKVKLTPAGILLICYFAAPVLVHWFMGVNDAISGSFTFSLLVQAGLGIAVVRKLFGLKQSLNGELIAWLSRFGQPQAKTQELAGQVSLAAGFISIVALIWPPVGEIITGSRLMTLIKVSALGYAGYLGYSIWKLAEPFMSFVPAAEPPAAPAAPPAAVSERRCVKCGQLIDDSAKLCAFCRHPIQ